MSNQDAFDATQRVTLDAGGHPTKVPPQQGQAKPPRPTPSRRAAQKKRRRQQITLLCLSIAAAILLLIIIFLLLTMLGGSVEDDGKILSNVYAAGVNLGGMTQDEAKAALKEQTDNTYSVLDMTVSVLDTTIALSPADTGASLDIDAVVEAAYNYGRTGSNAEQQRIRSQAQTTSHTISILNHLNLNTGYIQNAISELGDQYSTILKQSTYSIEGERPNLTQEKYDTETVYQTLTISLGTAEYGLNIDSLYQQVLDAYEINLFQVTAQCTMVPPDELDWELIYKTYCVAPVNALFDVDTYEVTEEVYGYGFTMEELTASLEAANYGDTIVLELKFIEPDILSEFYSQELFQDELATFSTPLAGNSNWIANIKKACTLLNGTIVKMGETFSFNDLIGEPSEDNGFYFAAEYLGMSYQDVLGGGICQVASTLYYCALASDLEIVERTGHSYAVDYIQAGFDAEIYYGTFDLKFTNTTDNAIRIDAAVTNGQLMISMMGTDTRDYTVELEFEIDQTYEPQTVYNTMLNGNDGGYKAGDILRPGITGYKISTYIVKYAPLTVEDEEGNIIDNPDVLYDEDGNPIPLEKTLIATSYYAKQDQVVVDIYQPPVVDPDPTGPDVTDPTDPSENDPSAPDETTEGTAAPDSSGGTSTAR